MVAVTVGDRKHRRHLGQYQSGLPAKELAYALQKSEVQGLVVIPSFRKSNYVGMLVELIPELRSRHADRLNSKAFPLLRRIFVYDPSDADGTQAPYQGFTTRPQVLAVASPIRI